MSHRAVCSTLMIGVPRRAKSGWQTTSSRGAVCCCCVLLPYGDVGWCCCAVWCCCMLLLLYGVAVCCCCVLLPDSAVCDAGWCCCMLLPDAVAVWRYCCCQMLLMYLYCHAAVCCLSISHRIALCSELTDSWLPGLSIGFSNHSETKMARRSVSNSSQTIQADCWKPLPQELPLATLANILASSNNRSSACLLKIYSHADSQIISLLSRSLEYSS